MGSIVQPDHDVEKKPMPGIYGTLNVQRTMKAELTAFLCLLKRISGPTTAHLDTKGIIDGLWREMKCIGPKANDVDLWILIWEVRRIRQEGAPLEVEHVKAHRSTCRGRQ